MGGPVGFTLRLEDGTIHKDCKYTNSIPFFIQNVKFLDADQDHIQSLLQHRYLEYNLLAPMGYGLTVVDMKEKVILNSQGYCSIGEFPASELQLSWLYREAPDSGLVETYQRFKALFARGLIRQMKLFNKEISVLEDSPALTWEETHIEFEAQRNLLGSFYLDLSPYTVKEFEGNTEGYMEMKEAIYHTGLQLTVEEEDAWESWFKQLEED